MAQPKEQNYANHARLVPGYHFVAFGILVLNLVYTVYKLVREFPTRPVFWGMHVLVAVAVLLVFFYARRFALTVQDRVIRLEMAFRMERLLPAELRPRIKEFSLDQLVALRFAGDDELPALASKVLTEKIGDRKTIKQLIKHWNADHLRV
jgi:hypothetical protein